MKGQGENHEVVVVGEGEWVQGKGLRASVLRIGGSWGFWERSTEGNR